MRAVRLRTSFRVRGGEDATHHGAERAEPTDLIEALAESETLTIDDFGAGHSSFGRLSDLPCQVPKIDRMFVARLPDDAGPASMVTAMLELADRLGMRAVAEGIETAEQLEFLIARGCPLGQGYLFSRPVAASR